MCSQRSPFEGLRTSLRRRGRYTWRAVPGENVPYTYLPKGADQMPNISSIAFRVHNMETMLNFYAEAFQVQFREVDTYGIRSQFGELNGITLKFVPIRDDADFKAFPIHQLGFVVSDVEAVISLALKHGGRQEGQIIRAGGKIQAAVRDPDGNTIELYSEE
jgi:predicted enzyme related to lactoylglutathione lyase